jgi:hypothetical protein
MRPVVVEHLLHALLRKQVRKNGVVLRQDAQFVVVPERAEVMNHCVARTVMLHPCLHAVLILGAIRNERNAYNVSNKRSNSVCMTHGREMPASSSIEQAQQGAQQQQQ